MKLWPWYRPWQEDRLQQIVCSTEHTLVGYRRWDRCNLDNGNRKNQIDRAISRLDTYYQTFGLVSALKGKKNGEARRVEGETQSIPYIGVRYVDKSKFDVEYFDISEFDISYFDIFRIISKYVISTYRSSIFKFRHIEVRYFIVRHIEVRYFKFRHIEVW